MTAQLLTPAQFRAHVETALEDEALQRLLDAAEADIDSNCGPLDMDDYDTPGEVTQWFTSSRGMQTLRTKQKAAAVVSVTEYDPASGDTDVTRLLVEDEDYWLDGGIIRGRNGYIFGGRIEVVYVPEDTRSRRTAVLIQLVKLEINVDPGTGFEGAGSWQHTSQDYEQNRQHLLWSLCPPPVLA